jgi:hypothetical protein
MGRFAYLMEGNLTRNGIKGRKLTLLNRGWSTSISKVARFIGGGWMELMKWE